MYFYTWQIFWLIAIPLCLEGLTVTGIIVFSFCWNEALFASAIAPQHAATLATFILASRSTQGLNFNIAAVNTLIAIMPPVLMSLFVHRYLAGGLSFGAVKGYVGRIRDFLASAAPNLRLSAAEERRGSTIDGSAQFRKCS